LSIFRPSQSRGPFHSLHKRASRAFAETCWTWWGQDSVPAHARSFSARESRIIPSKPIARQRAPSNPGPTRAGPPGIDLQSFAATALDTFSRREWVSLSLARLPFASIPVGTRVGAARSCGSAALSPIRRGYSGFSPPGSWLVSFPVMTNRLGSLLSGGKSAE